jgi:hypothetical protein
MSLQRCYVNPLVLMDNDNDRLVIYFLLHIVQRVHAATCILAVAFCTALFRQQAPL